MEHKIPLKPGIKPFKQKLRKINPILLPVIEKEVKKLMDAKIIVPLRYSEWVANLVPVRKKNGEIRFCVDFRNLNRSSLKDNYPLPKMDHVLEKVVRANIMSMIDGFSGYNQIIVHQDDKEKNTFITYYSKIFLTIAILHRGPFFISLCRLINIFFYKSIAKTYIFPHIRSLTSLQDVYMLDSPLHLAYIGICARKYNIRSGLHVTTEDL
jgi:hypothetical protein